MSKIYYRQCNLKKNNSYQTSWLPEKFAVVGKVVKLRNDETDEWDNGWVVTAAGENRLPEAPHAEGMIRSHRKATGDSLPKVK